MEQSRAQLYTKEEWEKVKPFIQDLYCQRKLPYKSVIRLLHDEHGIVLT